jgi:tetratricopeptide (TPR) repeat protein
MPTEYDNNLLREGILYFKAGEYDTARRYIERALDVADDYPTRSEAYYYLSQLTDDPKKKRDYLEETLAMDPVHAEARRALAILDGRLKPEDIINPDVIQSPVAGTVNVSADRFTCPKCGGRMVYAPDGRSLVCEFCARSQPMGGQIAAEQDFFAAMATSKGHSTSVSTQIFHCQGCGAEFLLGAQELSAVCSYCGSTHVIRQSRELAAPDAILPFGFDRREAIRRLVAWVEENRIEPAGKVEVPRPLYLPVWAFDIIGNIPWSGQVYKNKRLVPVSGEKSVFFHDIIVPATQKLPRLLPTVLEGFNFSITAPYNPSYLAGWPAEVHAISLSDAALEARRIAVERVRGEVRSEYSHVQDLRYQSSAISVNMFNLVLVPVWLTEIPLSRAGTGITVEGGSFPVVVNGVTGAVCGETPSRGIFEWLLGSQ